MSRWSKYWLLVFVASSVSLCVSSCPVGCTCTEYLNVDCSGNGSTSVPNKLPLNTTYLTLTGYRLPVLDLRVLGGLKKLRGLKLPSNEITLIEGTLEVFPSLYELNLSKNKLTSVTPRTFGDAAKRLGYVDLSQNPFDCDCGGLPLNSLCDCSVHLFNCTCNILWLKEQVKQKPSAWVGVRCQDKDIQTVDIQDYWCRYKWRYLLPIILACVVIAIPSIVCVYKLRYKLCYKCKKRNRYALLGTDMVTERQLNELAVKLGMEWESLATHLGFTRAELEAFIRDNDRNMRGQIRAMLIAWKYKNGEQATVATLVEQLKSFDPPLDPDIYVFPEVSSPSP
ncbi:PREDICTED: slit homolog 1 protein-like [Branchiostoma belcheri]|uniref:Slit homolog 1 protein-like n=1 Tax=Branchiostoma belcheri TaxID=7741 RepID=A0A6P4Y208_BRABE|nr:PREDICTED: slit homolog 1 protein-like [Branchiostoma belcheri]